MVIIIANLALLCIVSFFQNMTFTWASRSRNSGDVKYHFYVALLSNSVWFSCNFFLILPEMLKVLESGDQLMRIAIMACYVISTSLGSAFMMYILLKTEKGKKKVGG